MELKDRLADRIRALRKGCDMTQEDLANRIGRSHDVVSNIERGVTLPTLDILEALSTAFDMTLAELFSGLSNEKTDKQRMTVLHDIISEAERLTTPRLKKMREILAILNK